MASFLQKEAHVSCLAGGDDYEIPPEKSGKGGQSRLILWDCQGKPGEECLFHFETACVTRANHDVVAFFNLRNDFNIEDEAIAHGIRGLFYEAEPLDRLPKGVQAILKGELWLSRQVMSKYILKEKPTISNRSSTAAKILSQREIEILSLVTIGATNEDIANELNISPHTVKTHVYNIFKKISVPNRLQAALWVGKNF